MSFENFHIIEDVNCNCTVDGIEIGQFFQTFNDNTKQWTRFVYVKPYSAIGWEMPNDAEAIGVISVSECVLVRLLINAKARIVECVTQPTFSLKLEN